MCEPSPMHSTEPHASLIDAARQLLSQADRTPGMVLQPWYLLPGLYEVTALVERWLRILGTEGTDSQPIAHVRLRDGSREAADCLSQACRTLERAWIAGYPVGPAQLTFPLTQPKEAA